MGGEGRAGAAGRTNVPGTEMGSGKEWPFPLGPAGFVVLCRLSGPMVEITAEDLRETSELQVQLWGPLRQ